MRDAIALKFANGTLCWSVRRSIHSHKILNSNIRLQVRNTRMMIRIQCFKTSVRAVPLYRSPENHSNTRL